MPYKDPEKERACGRRRYERITAERIARGMCPRCGKARPAPDRTLCRHCGEKRRKAARARCAKAKAAGIPYGGRDPERCREFARDRSRRRDRARQDARTCTRCGTHPPVEGGTVCEPCRVARRDRERKQYAARRPPACAAGAARPRPVMPRIATGAPGARPNAQEKWRKMQGADSVIPGGAPGGFASIVPHRPRARPGVLRAPAGPGRVRASIAGCRFCHLELLSSRSPPARIMGHGTGGKM